MQPRTPQKTDVPGVLGVPYRLKPENTGLVAMEHQRAEGGTQGVLNTNGVL
ncbi:hypothetical protein [Pseudomonas jinjuensis]|uniref:hypothetical protein n=1 Tax=Pseudomonas jinjuensis TaxID=198616 RepID=UPI00146FC314|nr:hypothetical protein [Pseudomonas jinjuensis]